MCFIQQIEEISVSAKVKNVSDRSKKRTHDGQFYVQYEIIKV